MSWVELDALAAGEAFEFFLGSAVCVFVLELAAFVVVGFAAPESEFGLRLAPFEVDAKDDERKPALLELSRQLA